MKTLGDIVKLGLFIVIWVMIGILLLPWRKTIDDEMYGVVAIIPSADSGIGGVGTGFFIDENKIITNAHVIAVLDDKPGHLEILMKDTYRTYPVEVVGRDALSDIAVLKLSDLNWEKFKKEQRYEILKMNDDDSNVKQGDRVIAIGHPHGLMWSVSEGIVSATERNRADLILNGSRPMIQTDAGVFPGNSGGPLIDKDTGYVIAINEMLQSMQGGGTYTFSIPAEWAMRIIDDITDEDKLVKWSTLGIHLEFGPNGEVVVGDIDKDKPAAASGLEKGDILETIYHGYNSKDILKPENVLQFLGYIPADEIIIVEILRGKEQKKFKIKTLGKLSSEYKESLPVEK